jgi:ribosomal protein S18 acetylase RimI-like enzyme
MSDNAQPTTNPTQVVKFSIQPLHNAQDLTDAKHLFRQYVNSLGIDLSFQSFEAELAELPGKYAQPTGELLLGRNSNGDAVGCVALRPLPYQKPEDDRKVCEMKRLYVSPACRGGRLGKQLAECIIEIAEGLGYEEMRLDTLPTMKAAVKLYSELGFVDGDRYYENPIEGTRFLKLSLPRRKESVAESRA